MAISFRMPSSLSLRRSGYKQGRFKKIPNSDSQEFKFDFEEEEQLDDEITTECVQLHVKSKPKLESNLQCAIQPGDTLQSLALKYGCSISELKRLNNLISDQEFFALDIIKIPAKPFSLLSEILPIASYPVRSQNNNNSHLYSEDSEPNSFLQDVDRDIERIVQNTLITNDSYGNGPGLNQVHFQGKVKSSYDGANCGISWCHLLIVIIVLGILTPALYGVYFVAFENKGENISVTHTTQWHV